ncbi:Nif3-like dinuclear metal center hexameric protein [Methylococcus sp. EFPC2]|uniref:Nif3-like dinuclear metal center hexameric protein n=1 Tax=Methylococcus sp. EFPC2 TaxID=2812648 RepID=UPI001966EB61|nr:Nif3-like dinuclear metal center hexameric protein [Methylococcus sp. EFPC2]QSA96464.1 Nif3-like dinuclear metal center hexameric protein [Methylococcus sp. EFPC2]
MAVEREALTAFFEDLLQASRFPDYGPNGLQIEGTARIARAAFAVSATADSVLQAIAGEAQALVVHHGLFWKFHGARPLTGPFARRVLPLVRHEVNLYGYHLPLDAHPEVGNAATLGRAIGLVEQTPFGDYQGVPTGVKGQLADAPSAGELRERLSGLLNREVWLSSPDDTARVRSLGIITGGANGEWKQAVAAGLDAYLTGEMSEHDWHEAQEAGIHMYAGGHHATERFGIRALMAYTESRLNLNCFFIDSENPA